MHTLRTSLPDLPPVPKPTLRMDVLLVHLFGPGSSALPELMRPALYLDARLSSRTVATHHWLNIDCLLVLLKQ